MPAVYEYVQVIIRQNTVSYSIMCEERETIVIPCCRLPYILLEFIQYVNTGHICLLMEMIMVWFQRWEHIRYTLVEKTHAYVMTFVLVNNFIFFSFLWLDLYEIYIFTFYLYDVIHSQKHSLIKQTFSLDLLSFRECLLHPMTVGYTCENICPV